MARAQATISEARLRLAGFDPGLALALLAGALAAWPFLSRPSLPVFTDTEQHVYRTYEIIAAWRAGVPYLRWAPDLFHAFGYPVFHYYAPLTYYLGAAYGFALGDGGAVAGVKFVYVAAAFAGALGAFLLGRQVWNSLAGVTAAAAFVLSPYLVYVEPHALGRAPESFALALAPGVFWAFERVRRRPAPGRVLLAALALAALLLAHNLMALIYLALLGAWLAWAQAASPTAPRGVLALTAALLLGLCLAAFFWLPAVAERDAVQLANATASPYLDYRRNFVPAGELFAPAAAADTAPHRVSFRLGLPQWTLALMGALALLLARRRAWWFWLPVAAGLVFAITPAARPLWDRLPPLAMLQFPWRLLGPLAFVLALLAAAGVGEAERWAGPRARLVVGTLAIAACVAGGLPLLNPLPWAEFGAVDALRVLRAEFDWEVGTTATNEFLPVQVLSVPPAQPTLLESYAFGQVDKVNRATLPAGTEVVVTGHWPEAESFAVRAPEAFIFRLYTFDFPGWTARVDGQPVPITPSEPEGWITFPVPAGEHTVEVRLEDTAPRRWGWWLSGIAVLGCLGLAAGHWRERRAARQAPPTAPAPVGLAWPQAAALSAVLVAGLGTSFLGAWSGQQAEAAAQPLVARLEGNLGLARFELVTTTVRAGESLGLTLHWTATGRVTRNLRVFVHAIGPDGALWAQSDKFHPGRYEDLPTGRWPPGYGLADAHTLWLAPDAPAGRYRLYTGLWDGYTGRRARLLDEHGLPTDVDAVLITDGLEVVR